MRKLLVTILAMLYMLSATGATVHIHYCMGRVLSAELFHHSSSDRCDRCGMKKALQKKGCCKDEHKTFKSADHQLAKIAFDHNFSHTVIINRSGSSPRSKFLTAGRPLGSGYAHAPPSFWRTCPIYIQVCNFRI